MTTGKTITLTRQTFVGKVMSLLFNMLSRLVIVFLPRSKRLLISWLHLPPAVILELPKIKSLTVSTISTSQFSSVAQLCPTLCKPMNRGTPGLPVHNQLLEPIQTHVSRTSDTIQPSHPLSSPSPPALHLSQHQGLSKWISSLHQVAKVLELQLQHQSFQWIFRTGFL